MRSHTEASLVDAFYHALLHVSAHERRRCADYWRRKGAEDAVRRMHVEGAALRFVEAWQSDGDDGWPWYEEMAKRIDELAEALR
jgi:hypothetical protein